MAVSFTLKTTVPRAILLLACMLAAAGALALELAAQGQTKPQASAPIRKVKGRMQARPGGPVEEIAVAVHEAPVDLPTVSADRAPLREDELVLGVVLDGQAIAYPVRYLALFEVVDHRAGETAVAPTW